MRNAHAQTHPTQHTHYHTATLTVSVLRWMMAAEKGDMLGLHAVGVAYHQGQGVAVNYNEVR